MTSRISALFCILAVVTASTQPATPDYYPLDSGREWTYETDFNGVTSLVRLRNIGSMKTYPNFLAQGATVKGRLVETKLFLRDDNGVFLAGTITPSKPPSMSSTPRPIILLPVSALREWEREVEQHLACAIPARGKMRVTVQGTDDIEVAGTKHAAVRVNSAARFNETCGPGQAALVVDYEESSWFIDGIGLARSRITTKTLGTVRVNSIELKEFQSQARKPRR